MQQQLQFEASWDKALATEDRHSIENIFHETKHLNATEILFSPIREAINHKEELLITVLVHNFSDKNLQFNNTRILYKIEGEVIADHVFTLPAIMVPPNVSMPWTFIFPKDNYLLKRTYQNGRLEIQ